MPLKRRFLQVGPRRVHYLRAGAGPPVVLIHSSPANAWFLRPEIEHLATTYTVFAFDTPGFGLSQPLPLETMVVADLADAFAETLAAIRMPACPVFGSHSGAAIALELGVRHPERVTGLVLDGVPAFTAEECTALFGDYFRSLPITDLGGHYAEIWTRFRDQSIWFPWSHRGPDHLNGYDLSAPASTHLWASMYFEAADTYRPAYYATSHYGARAIAAVAELDRPAVFTATPTDMLYPHMARFGPLKPGQTIREIGSEPAAKYALIAESFADFGSPHEAPADVDALVSEPTLSRQFIDRPEADGGQIHLRYAGDRAHPAVLLIHDLPGSGAAFESLIEGLADRYFVIVPDLPGAGESDVLETPSTTVAEFAQACAEMLDVTGIAQTQVFGLGFGASIAVELAACAPDRVTHLVLGGLLAASADERAALAAAYTPEITIERDGAHWYRTWLMLRDSLVWWPWYDRRKVSQRHTIEDFGAERLHRWTLEVMRRHETYGDAIQAALVQDAPAVVETLTTPFTYLSGAPSPLAIYDAVLAERWPDKALPDVRDTARSLADRLRQAFH